MFRKKTYAIPVLLSVAVVIAVTAVGCTSDPAIPEDPAEGTTVRVSAEVARQLYTKGYRESGDVVDGTYYLTYPAASGADALATVRFGQETETPGMGIVMKESAALKWIDVKQPTPTFFLDNVSPASSSGSDATEVVFSDSYNPFKAGLFDQVNGNNDLLWGSTTATHGTKTVNFDLHHYMSRLRVEITVNHTNGYEEDNLDLIEKEATVSITNLIHTPLSYNRLDGSLALGNQYAELELVNTAINWEKTPGKDDAGSDPSDKDVYITQDFVLPPQNLLEDENRPKLVIQLNNGTVYSGILPHAMLVVDETTNEITYPVALHFLKEHILTIRTTITEDPPELIFMPVTVVQWVDKGEFTVEAHQAGIYTATEFSRLISYYASNNEYQLIRYGKLVQGQESADEKWEFVFFHSVTLDYDTIAGSMSDRTKGQKDFYFTFNNYAVYVQKTGAAPEQVTPEELYKIVADPKSTSP